MVKKRILVQFLRLYVQIILKCVQLEKNMVVECSRILVEILRASRSRFYHKHMYNCREKELKFIREPPTKLFLDRLKFRGKE